MLVDVLPDAPPVSAARFVELARGVEGVSYRLAKIDRVYPTHLESSGEARLSYRADGRCPLTGGDSTLELEPELERSAPHDGPGIVSLVVRDDEERPVEERLVARGGRLETSRTTTGPAPPNGTGFSITLDAAGAPEIDGRHVVVGRVREGDAGSADALAAVRAVPVNAPNTDSALLQAGLRAGDKRANVAVRGFARPLAKVVVARAGVLGEGGEGE